MTKQQNTLKGFAKHLSEFEFNALIKGKHLGFTAAYKMYSNCVFSLAWYLTKDHGLAEDIMQKTFEKLLQNSSTIKQRETLGGWLKQCVINETASWFRKHPQLYTISELSEELSNASELPITTTLATGCLNQLPTQAKNVIYQHVVLGEKHSEIALKMGIEADHSRQIYHRAVKQIRQWLLAKGLK